MSSRKALLGAIACLALARPVGAAEPLRLDYSVTWGSVEIGRIEVTTLQREGRYLLESRARTLGILAFFAPLQSVSTAEGLTGEDGRAVPSVFSVTSRWRDEERQLALGLDPNGQILSDERSEPPPDSEYVPEPVPTALQQGPDPLSLLLTATRHALPDKVLRGRSYDGRRVIDSTLACGGVEPSSITPVAVGLGPIFVCTLSAELVAGGRRGGSSRRMVEGPARVWLARGFGDGGAWPVRLELDTRLGQVVALPIPSAARAGLTAPGEHTPPG